MNAARWLPSLIVVLGPSLATAAADPAPASDEEVAATPDNEPADRAPVAPAAPPAEPITPLPDVAGFAPDPTASHPAGLDPRTLCQADHGCAPDVVSAVAAPLSLAASVSAALLGFHGHPTRTDGSELLVRLDLWRGESWAGQLGYTLDLIGTQAGAATGSVTPYTDLMLGGRLTLPVARPSWLVASAHLLVGSATGGNGAALYGAVGTRAAGLELQLGLAVLTLDGDGGGTASVRATRRGVAVDGWAELAVQNTVIGGAGVLHVNGGAGLELHHRALRLGLSALLGDRAFSLLDDGAEVEAVDDTFHATGRALLGYDLGPRLRPYLGASLRTATTTDGIDYTLLAGFAGLALTF